MKKIWKLCSAILVLAMLLNSTAAVPEAQEETLGSVSVSHTRLGGTSRYDTASKIATAAFPEGAAYGILVSGANFPDALAVSAYAGAKKAPILLTAPKALSKETGALISTLGITSITIVGGYASVSEDIEKTLTDSFGVKTISRIAGKNRIETARKVYETGKEEGIFSDDACVIVSGAKAADALSMSPWAYADKMPIFLADSKGQLASEDLAYASSFSKVYIAGGSGSVGTAVSNSLGSAVKRFDGKNRYDTSAKIAEYFAGSADSHYENTVFASGKDSHVADPLAGAMLAGLRQTPLLLADGTSGAGIDLVARSYYKAGVTSFTVLGSVTSFSEETVNAIADAIKDAANPYKITYSHLTVEKNSLGTVEAYGIVQVKNTGSDNLYLNATSFDFYKAGGAIVASDSLVNAVPDIIAPGETGYFYDFGHSLPDGSDPKAAYTLKANLNIRKSTNPIVRYTISQTSKSKGFLNSPKFTGRVTNNTSEDDSLCFLEIVMFNAKGIPLGVDSSNISDLKAGKTLGFETTAWMQPSTVSYSTVASFKAYACKLQYQYD